ncbi:polysaccharide biosynthesis/export family protein [Alloacidobacterium dinghuense]|uniref:Polysaccharide biosynthesis/export family protein n=2 Tax=Alloacidobacterium dinghuense TaxID=2763107 RepID=A0A7G8BRL8_9BACT|nr:polysaccharide biosynthesis/export family protein [Alloacidobacterium dinghuense]
MKGIGLLLATLLIASIVHADDQLHKRPRYTLHVGDVVDLSYRLTPEYNQSVTIQPDGYASLNVAGDVHLEGLTLDEAHDLIIKKDSERLNDPELNLILSSFQRPYVIVGGEVLQPGRIDLRENMTAMQAVMMAGGFKLSAKDTKIVVFRHINADMGEVRELNLHNINKTAKLEQDMVLQPGDMLLVPANKMEHFARYMHAFSFSSSFAPSSVF